VARSTASSACTALHRGAPGSERLWHEPHQGLHCEHPRRLTWSRDPAQSEKAGRQRGGAHGCMTVVPGGSGGQGSGPRLGELL
jgi:hypothetical protein